MTEGFAEATLTPFICDNLELPSILEDLATVGATSVKLLTEEFRLDLRKTAVGYSYQPQQEVVGRSNRLVYQQVSSLDYFSEETPFSQLRRAFQALLEQRLAEVVPYPFATSLHFNAMVLQKYEKGALGITPHLDGKRYVNLVCIFVLEGEGKFYVCDNRAGDNPREIDATLGKVIFMRAPGFRGMENNRPFHFVTNISSDRYTLTLRQNARC